ncbi:hypothetical protein D9758_011273 [Tetrapyrgos nigripes]|uniref:Cytochrome P450 n=1 Tax=Tetrapyrgos nigripes TaxID=182062 RepID=A0A8H5FSS4_9AGAR|nr:hypothetical protein D9758_011273 [Tetrapyrgos nigripes]
MFIQDIYRSMAGSETTSQTLGYALWELAKNRAVQDKLRAELMSMPSDLTYEDIQSGTKLPYLVGCSLKQSPAKWSIIFDAVTWETLRFHPAAPYMERVSLKLDALPLHQPLTTNTGEILNEITIEKGQCGETGAPTGLKDGLNPCCPQLNCPVDGLIFWPSAMDLEIAFDSGLVSIGFIDTVIVPLKTVIFPRWAAIFQFKVILAGLIRKFEFHDTGATIKSKVTSSMQPVTIGQENISPRLPVTVTLV